jgi:hypothetical protein
MIVISIYVVGKIKHKKIKEHNQNIRILHGNFKIEEKTMRPLSKLTTREYNYAKFVAAHKQPILSKENI